MVPAIDVQRRVVRPYCAKSEQSFGHEPVGQAAPPVLRKGSYRVHESNGLRTRVLHVGFQVAERHGGRLAGRGHDGHQPKLWWFPQHQLILAARRESPMVGE